MGSGSRSYGSGTSRGTTIKPLRKRTTQDQVELQGGTREELWRGIRWLEIGHAVLIRVSSKCAKGHGVEELKSFDATVTLGETLDWMAQGPGMGYRRPCPDESVHGVHWL